MSEADFEVLLRRTGLALSAEQIADLREGYAHMEKLLDLIRPPRDRAVEPAHVFAPSRQP